MGDGAATMARERVEHGGSNGECDPLGSVWRREQRARDGMRAVAARRPVPPLWHDVIGPMAEYGHHAASAHYTQSSMTYG